MYELTRPSPHFKAYTVFPVNCLAAESSKPAAGTSPGQPCMRIRATGAGTITVKRASDNASQTLAFKDGEMQAIQCSEVTSVIGVTEVTIYW